MIFDADCKRISDISKTIQTFYRIDEYIEINHFNEDYIFFEIKTNNTIECVTVPVKNILEIRDFLNYCFPLEK